MSQGFGFFLDQRGAPSGRVNGVVDDSLSHTGCISLSAALADGATNRWSLGSASDAAAGTVFSVFREASRPVAREAGAGAARLVYSSDAAKAYSLTESYGHVCLVVATAEVSGAGCAPLSSAGSERPLVVSSVDRGQPVSVGLLPDGVSRVEVTRPGAAGSESQAVEHNVFVVRGRASSVSWNSQSGSSHVESLVAASART